MATTTKEDPKKEKAKTAIERARVRQRAIGRVLGVISRLDEADQLPTLRGALAIFDELGPPQRALDLDLDESESSA